MDFGTTKYYSTIVYKNTAFRKIPHVKLVDSLGEEYPPMSQKDIQRERGKLEFYKLSAWKYGGPTLESIVGREELVIGHLKAATELHYLEGKFDDHKPKWRIGRVASAFAALAIGGAAVTELAANQLVKPPSTTSMPAPSC